MGVEQFYLPLGHLSPGAMREEFPVCPKPEGEGYPRCPNCLSQIKNGDCSLGRSAAPARATTSWTSVAFASSDSDNELIPIQTLLVDNLTGGRLVRTLTKKEMKLANRGS